MKEEAEKKAKELYLMFLLKLPFNKEVSTENKHGKWTYDSEELAKEHALICVNEILKAWGVPINKQHESMMEFWQLVREIIENY